MRAKLSLAHRIALIGNHALTHTRALDLYRIWLLCSWTLTALFAGGLGGRYLQDVTALYYNLNLYIKFYLYVYDFTIVYIEVSWVCKP